MKIVNSMA